jgi:hypothetical protein
MKKHRNQSIIPFTLRGSYYSFLPVILPGLLLFIFALVQGSSNAIINIAVILFYVIIMVCIFLIKPQVTITDEAIITKWLYHQKSLKAHFIKKIVVASSNSILIYKNDQKLPIQLSLIYGFKTNLLYPILEDYAKRNHVVVEQRIKY